MLDIALKAISLIAIAGVFVWLAQFIEPWSGLWTAIVAMTVFFALGGASWAVKKFQEHQRAKQWQLDN